jgi:hypothetical protein
MCQSLLICTLMIGRRSAAAARTWKDKGPRAFRATLYAARDGILLGISAPDLGAFLPAVESLINLDDAAFATHRRQATVFHGFADAVAQKPSGFHAASESLLQLANGDPFLAAAHHVDSLQPDMHRGVTGLEDGPHTHGEGFPAGVAFVEAEPRSLAIQLADPRGSVAMRANRPIRPKARFDVIEGSGFAVQMTIGKGRLHGGLLLAQYPIEKHVVCKV